jgi:anti-anti-sigma factor
MSSELQITVSQEQGRVPITVFQLAGEIGSHNHEQLQTRAREAIEAGTRYLLLDLTNLGYMSSAGLRAMHTIYNMLQTANEASDAALEVATLSPYLKLLSPPANILRVIETIGFGDFVEIHNTLEQAVAAF